MSRSLRAVVGAFLVLSPALPAAPRALAPDARFLDNGRIRIGIDRSSGAAIFHFSESTTQRNVLNHYDRDRFIQQSYYGDADGSDWNGTFHDTPPSCEYSH